MFGSAVPGEDVMQALVLCPNPVTRKYVLAARVERREGECQTHRRIGRSRHGDDPACRLCQRRGSREEGCRMSLRSEPKEHQVERWRLAGEVAPSASLHSLARRRPDRESASASDGHWRPDTARGRAAFPSPSGSCCRDRQAGHTARLPRTRAHAPTGSVLETVTPAGHRACAACSRPTAPGSMRPVERTTSLIVLTTASAARRLSSFTSGKTRRSGFTLRSMAIRPPTPARP